MEIMYNKNTILKHFLRNISINNVTLMSDINKDFFLDKSSKSNYYQVDSFELDYFYDFVTSLDSNTLYSVIPMITTNNELNKPYMVLSRTILVTKYSNYKEIHHYTFAKYQEALKDFNIDKYSNFHCCFKFKKVRMDINQINKRFL